MGFFMGYSSPAPRLIPENQFTGWPALTIPGDCLQVEAMNKYEELAMQVMSADGGGLDQITHLSAISRINYGDGNLPKPNDYCYLTVDVFGNPIWEENDDHLRARINAMVAK